MNFNPGEYVHVHWRGAQRFLCAFLGECSDLKHLSKEQVLPYCGQNFGQGPECWVQSIPSLIGSVDQNSNSLRGEKASPTSTNFLNN